MSAEWEQAYADLEEQQLRTLDALHQAHDQLDRMVRSGTKEEPIMARAPRLNPADDPLNTAAPLRNGGMVSPGEGVATPERDATYVVDQPPSSPITPDAWSDQGPADDPGPFPPGPITQAVEENTLAAPVDETMDAVAELGAALDRKARKVGAALEDVAIAKAFRRLVDAVIKERQR